MTAAFGVVKNGDSSQMVYGAIERGEVGMTEASTQASSARRALILVGAIAATCLALSGALVASGAGGETELSFTSHLDLDKGALSALENAASGHGPSRGRHERAYADAQPRLPAVLKARFNNLMARESGAVGDDNSEMLASMSGKEDKQAEATEGMHTTDYKDMTDAAGEE